MLKKKLSKPSSLLYFYSFPNAFCNMLAYSSNTDGVPFGTVLSWWWFTGGSSKRHAPTFCFYEYCQQWSYSVRALRSTLNNPTTLDPREGYSVRANLSRDGHWRVFPHGGGEGVLFAPQCIADVRKFLSRHA